MTPIRNPFYDHPQRSDPRCWLPEDMTFIQRVQTPFQLKHLYSANITLNWMAESQVQQLIEDRAGGIPDYERSLLDLRKLLAIFITAAGHNRDIDVSIADSESTCINNQHFDIVEALSISIHELVIARCVDGLSRLYNRRQVDKTAQRIPQEIHDIIPLDIASLISIAQLHQDLGVPAFEGRYRAHLIYPTEDLQSLIALTALIPEDTLNTLEKGNEYMEPIIINTDIIPLDLNQDWPKNETLQVILGLVEEGKKLLELASRRD